MKATHFSSRVLMLSLALIISASFIQVFPNVEATPSSSYHYTFSVDKDGFTRVWVDFESSVTSGESWVFVPDSRFSAWSYTVTPGSTFQYQLVGTEKVVGKEYYFYQALEFSFQSTSTFKLSVQFNMSEGALIIEPRGMFFSAQIGFKPDSTGEAEVLLSTGYSIKEAVASGQFNYQPTEVSPRRDRVLFKLQENLMRLQVEFETDVSTPEFLTLERNDVFSFKTVKRYASYATDVLNLFEAVYSNFTRLFNVTLESINATFFIPDFDTFLSVGGYVPFTREIMGEIHINIFFVRGINGTIEVIALHELVHHFLWAAKLSPEDFLWFHEGLAQYVSIETIEGLGYEGATSERKRLEQGASQFISSPLYGESKLGIVQNWSPENKPMDLTTCYVASYYVVSELARQYGRLDYYNRFFDSLYGPPRVSVKDNDLLAYYLSLAANDTVDLTLKQWGFKITTLYTNTKIAPKLIDEAERTIGGLSPVFQPYKLIAELFYNQALISLERGNVKSAIQLLRIAISVATLAPILTLLTIAAILAAIVYVLHKRAMQPKPSVELPFPTVEQPVG